MSQEGLSESTDKKKSWLESDSAPEAVGFAGVLLLAGGVGWLYHPAAGLIVLGVCMVALAIYAGFGRG